MSGRPRLLVVTPDFPPSAGGIQVLVDRIATHVPRMTARVVTLTCAGAREYDATHPVAVRRVRTNRAPRPAAMAALNAAAIREAVRFRPQTVLSAHIVGSPAGAALQKTAGVPFVQYFHAKEIGSRPELARFALRRARASIVVSRYTHDLAVRAGGDPRRLRRIPPGVDLPPAMPGERREARPTIVTVGVLAERYKGHDVVLRALPLVRAQVPDVQWVVIGDGPLRPALEWLTAAHGLAGHVRFLGRVSDRERDRWLARAHVFAMPSRLPADGLAGEGFGIVYLEASAHGLPIVAGGVAGALDAVVPGTTGLLVDPTDHVRVADAISGLLRDRERAEALGRAGRAYAARFAWPEIARRVEDVVLEVAASCGSSS
jgi:phosphatidylinositol alpha-1,6-mannosyltransferase